MYPRPSFPTPVPLGQMSREQQFWMQQQQQQLAALNQGSADHSQTQQQPAGQGSPTGGAAAGSSSHSTGGSTSILTASPAGSSIVEDNSHQFACRSCKPPIWFSTSGAQRRHRTNEHIQSVQVTLNTGEIYRVSRNAEGFFRCPSCKHNSKSADYLPVHVRKLGVKTCRWEDKWPFNLPAEWVRLDPRSSSMASLSAAAAGSSSAVSPPLVLSPPASSPGAALSRLAPQAPPAAGHPLPSAATRYQCGPIPTGAILPAPPTMTNPRPPVPGSYGATHGPPPPGFGIQPGFFQQQQQHQHHTPAYPHPHYHSLLDLGGQRPLFRPSMSGPRLSTQSSPTYGTAPGPFAFDDSDVVGSGGGNNGQTSRSSSSSSSNGGSGPSQTVPTPAALAQAAYAARPQYTLTPEVSQWFFGLSPDDQARIRGDTQAAISHYQASSFGQQQMQQQMYQRQQQQMALSGPPPAFSPQQSSSSFSPLHAPLSFVPPRPSSAQGSLHPLGASWTLPGLSLSVTPAHHGVGQVGIFPGSSLAPAPMTALARSSPSPSPSPTPAAQQTERLFRAGEPTEVSLSIPVRADEIAAIAARASATVLEKETQLDAASTAATAGSSTVAAEMGSADRSVSPDPSGAVLNDQDGGQLEGEGQLSMEDGSISAAGQTAEAFEGAFEAGSDREGRQARSHAVMTGATADVDHDSTTANVGQQARLGSPIRPSAVPAAAMPEIRPGTPTSPPAIVSPQADAATGSPTVFIPLHDVVHVDATTVDAGPAAQTFDGNDAGLAAEREGASPALPLNAFVELVSGDNELVKGGPADGE